jgi:hypothetical protein
MVYKYGMRLRGFSIGCQPMNGLMLISDDPDHDYHDLLFYNHELTAKELDDFELDFIAALTNEEYGELIYD